MEQKQYTAEFTPEAIEQLITLSVENRVKIAEAIRIFEYVGTAYKNINNLGDGLFEIKPSGVRAYFAYNPFKRRMVIIGFICLKKTQKAPKQYIEQAKINIKKYINKGM